jgi:hypothetical protein
MGGQCGYAFIAFIHVLYYYVCIRGSEAGRFKVNQEVETQRVSSDRRLVHETVRADRSSRSVRALVGRNLLTAGAEAGTGTASVCHLYSSDTVRYCITPTPNPDTMYTIVCLSLFPSLRRRRPLFSYINGRVSSVSTETTRDPLVAISWHL